MRKFWWEISNWISPFWEKDLFINFYQWNHLPNSRWHRDLFSLNKIEFIKSQWWISRRSHSSHSLKSDDPINKSHPVYWKSPFNSFINHSDRLTITRCFPIERCFSNNNKRKRKTQLLGWKLSPVVFYR